MAKAWIVKGADVADGIAGRISSTGATLGVLAGGVSNLSRKEGYRGARGRRRAR
jgi:hypothetical protein